MVYEVTVNLVMGFELKCEFLILFILLGFGISMWGFGNFKFWG